MPAKERLDLVGPGARVATLEAFLRAAPKGQRTRVASAYCTFEALRELDGALRPTAGILLAGVDDAVTDARIFDPPESPSARWLERWEIRPTSTEHARPPRRGVIFHPKIVWVGEGAATVAYVGSGNLTRRGLGLNVEVGVILRGKEVGRQLEVVWRKLAEYSKSLEDFDVAAYRAKRRFRTAGGAPIDTPEGERVLVVDLNLVGGTRTQIQFSPHVAQAFFGRFAGFQPEGTTSGLRFSA